MHVYMFTRQDFEVSSDISLYPTLGKPLTLNCVPPESVPPANVFWVIKKPYGGFDAVNYDARVSMDHECTFFCVLFDHGSVCVCVCVCVCMCVCVCVQFA